MIEFLAFIGPVKALAYGFGFGLFAGIVFAIWVSAQPRKLSPGEFNDFARSEMVRRAKGEN